MPFIAAIDYDGTLFGGSFEDKGDPFIDVINKAKEFKENGAEVVLWTCREGLKLHEAIVRCKEFGLEFDAINDNSPSQVHFLQKVLRSDGYVFCHRKIYADIYVDDKSPGSIEFFLKLDAKCACEKYEHR